MTLEFLKIAFKNLRTRPVRSWLTILGIVIGIFLVTSLLSLSEGLKESVMRELRMMGGDMIIVMPGGTDIITSLIGGLELKNEDILAIERSVGVESVIQMPWSAEVARHEGEAKVSLITGISFDVGIPLLRDDMGWHVVDGDFPRPGRREIMVGNLVPREVFPGLIPGNEIVIKGRRFVVSGVLRSLGNKQDDMNLIMDLDDFRAVTGKREGSPMALVKIAPGFDVDDVILNIEENLERTVRRRGGEDSPGFSVISSETVSDMVGNIMGILQLAVFAFASIAIIVGGIGIMNTMYTSVKERTKEIGILKAIGAKKSHITAIFLFEAGIIGLIGGLGGVFGGIFLAKTVEIFLREVHPVLYLEAHISPLLIIFGLSFSFLMGCISGLLPARQAASMMPVDALRYE